MINDVLAHYYPFASQSAKGANWTGYPMMGPGMMGWWGGSQMTGGWQTGFWLWSILAWVTWLLIIVALVALIRWLWKKGDKEK